MSDDSKRCCHCLFYTDIDSECHLNPPAYAGDTENEDGIAVPRFIQPFIRYEWAEWCSHWQAADPSQTAEDRLRDINRLAEIDKPPE